MTLTTNSSPFAGLGKVIIVLVIVGGLVGIALGPTDVLNFITNSQKAKTQAGKDAIDLKYYDLVKGSETEGELARDQIDVQLYPEKVRQEMDFTNAVRYALLGIATLMVLGLGFKLLGKISPAKAGKKEQQKEADLRALQIKLARQQELLSRMAKQQEEAGSTNGSKEVIQKRSPHDGSYISISNN